MSSSLLASINLVLVACLALVGCTAGSPLPSETVPVESAPQETVPVGSEVPGGPAAIEAVAWRLIGYADQKGNQSDVLTGVLITLQFKTGRVSGNAGCNNYFAAYQIDSENLIFSNAGLTEMFCAEPPRIMDQEKAYLEALQEVSTYQISADRLLLRDESGLTLLTFTQDESAELPNSAWEIIYDSEQEGDSTAGVLSAQSLQNSVYLSDWTADGLAQLQAGEYREQAAPGSASEIVVTLTSSLAYGILQDGQAFAAVILTTDPGGSGVFFDLAIVVDENGSPQNITKIFLGDRIQVQSITVEGDEIILSTIAHGPDDPFCCPTQRELRRYALRDGELQLLSSEVITASGLVGVVWQWLEFQGMDDSLVIIDQPEQYTLTFKEDGTLQIKADCNLAGGYYTTQNSSLQIVVQNSTMAQCELGSRSEKFLESLNHIGSYIIEDGYLYLALMMDGGILKFAPGLP